MVRRAPARAGALALLWVAAWSVPSVITPPASAAPVKVDATRYTATCTGVNGQVRWRPGLSAKTGDGDITAKVRLTLSGCTALPASGGPPVAVSAAVVRGEISHASPCSNAVQATGSVRVRWSDSPKLSSGDTLLGDTAGFFVAPYDYPTYYWYLQLGPHDGAPPGYPGGSTGSFSGADGGAEAYLVMDLTTTFLYACQSTFPVTSSAVTTEPGDYSVAKFG